MKRVRRILVTLALMIIVAAIAYGVISSRGVAEGGAENKVVVVSPHPIEFMKPLAC